MFNLYIDYSGHLSKYYVQHTPSYTLLCLRITYSVIVRCKTFILNQVEETISETMK